MYSNTEKNKSNIIIIILKCSTIMLNLQAILNLAMWP